MLRKSIIIAHKSIDYIVLISALLLFLICLYAMIDAYMVYAGANDSNIMKYKPAAGNTEILRELSGDAVAWLTVDNTKIDYPVMQGETNSEYLNKDPYGEFSLSGSIFLDSRNDKMFSDPYSLVYGHHMEYGAMFGSLDGYADREYFDAHRTGTLTVIKGAEYKITFFASCKAQATDKVIFDPPESSNQALLAYLKKHAIIYDPRGVSAGSKLIALSTCQSAESYERMIVFGTLN
ncbi:class B sortase [Ruminococcus sp. JE7B6]|uniref:class B sortase n=1 Tax=Ruminococcus sp. JE7B6 TaxID=3233380 RepID=UPI00389AE4C2